jgi:hypothetical protein
LAENAVRSFEIISNEYSNGILKSGAVDLMMNYIHFLIGPCQNQILTIVKRTFRNFNDLEDLDNRIMGLLSSVRDFLSNDNAYDHIAVEIF